MEDAALDTHCFHCLQSRSVRKSWGRLSSGSWARGSPSPRCREHRQPLLNNTWRLVLIWLWSPVALIQLFRLLFVCSVVFNTSFTSSSVRVGHNQSYYLTLKCINIAPPGVSGELLDVLLCAGGLWEELILNQLSEKETRTETEGLCEYWRPRWRETIPTGFSRWLFRCVLKLKTGLLLFYPVGVHSPSNTALVSQPRAKFIKVTENYEQKNLLGQKW